MPNHVTHRVAVAGKSEAVAEFFATCITLDSDNEPRFDFNTLTPMPEILRDSESSSNVSMGLAALGMGDIGGTGFGMSSSAEFYLDCPWVKDLGITDEDGFRRYVCTRRPEAIVAAGRALLCHRETGHADWYGWSLKYWGTKWNAYSYREVSHEPDAEGEMGYLEFLFETAWSPPLPIFDRLAERFPALRFEIACFDEGWCFAGNGVIENGTVDFETTTATDDLYRKVHGEDPEKEEEADSPAAED